MISVNGRLRLAQLMGMALATVTLTACQAKPEPRVCHLEFTNGAELLDMPLAVTASQQSQGLQGVTDPAPGMVFRWQEPVQPAMWMKDTPAALDAAFITEDGVVVHTAAMEPHSETLHYAPEPVIAVVEVPAGELDTLGISKGSQVAVTSCW